MSSMSLQTNTALIDAQSSASRPSRTNDVERARKTAEEFEAVFLTQMLKPMFDGIKSEAPFGGGQAEKMWKSMQLDEYGKAIAKSGGIGISDAVFNELLKTQEIGQ